MNEYCVETAGLLAGSIYRRSSSKGYQLYHKWNPAKQKWVPSGDAEAAFAPNSSCRPLSEEEAQQAAKECCRNWQQLNWQL